MKIGDFCSYAPKSQIKAGEAKENAKYMFFTSSMEVDKKYDDYQIDGEGIIMGTGGRATIHYYSGKFSTSTDCVVLQTNSKIRCKYLYYFLKANINILEAGFKGAGLKHTNKAYISGIKIDRIPPFNHQDKVIEALDLLQNVIRNREMELDRLNELIKARFVEMFGDPVHNPHGWDKTDLKELADLKIGPFGSLLHKEDYIKGGHAFVNPSHIVDERIYADPKLTVSNEKYEELSAYHLKVGDVIMGRRGEMGRCAVVEEEGLLCGTGCLLIRPKGKVTADFIQKIISYPTFKKTIEDMAVGQTMPNLNVLVVSGFRIITPPIEVQKNYYYFIAQVDKSKVAIQKALDQAQTLFDSLMQEYFG